ncbi:MAG TPA: hypothetical protein HA326_09500, partial [Thermoplasmata archaeon]|nr:hypothetical protein [Thermoplasmata archaeon]
MSEPEGTPSLAARLRGVFLRAHARLLFPLLLLVVLVLLSVLLFGVNGLNSVVNGVTDASVLIPGAVGLSLLYGIRKFANFAHGELMTLGGYTAFFVNVQLGLALYWGFLAAPIVLAVVGILLELLIFSKLEGRGPIAALVASIGLSLFLQNLVKGTTHLGIGQEAVAGLPFAGPGHAGHFETSCVMAVRPDLPQLDRRFPPDREPRPLAISGQVHGVAVRYPGIWEASAGVSDAAD